MELLRELTDVTANHCLGRINVLDTEKKDLAEDGDLVDRFYWLIRSEKSWGERELSTQIYGDAEEKNYNRFQKLKARLLKRLSNTLFFVGYKDDSLTSLQQANLQVHRDYALGKLLSFKRAVKAANYFFRRALKTSIKYEIVDIALMTLDPLLYHSGVLKIRANEYEEYSRLIEKVKLEALAEVDARQKQTEVLRSYGASPQAREKVAEISGQAIQELDEKYSEVVGTFRYLFSYYFIKLHGLESRGEIDELIPTVREAVAKLEAKDFPIPYGIAQFQMYELVAYILKRDYNNGIYILERIASNVPLYALGWFKAQEFAFTLGMHTKNYHQAFRTYIMVVKTDAFKKLRGISRESWLLYRAYLYYLREIGLVDFDPADDPLGKFRLMKFLNNVPEYAKEKAGMNIPILVLQVIFAMATRKYTISVERIESIQQYCGRYIRRGEQFRSNCFIKALVQLPIAGFHRNAAKRLAQPYLDKLVTQAADMMTQDYRIEIVPYEVIWPEVINSMELKRQVVTFQPKTQ